MDRIEYVPRIARGGSSTESMPSRECELSCPTAWSNIVIDRLSLSLLASKSHEVIANLQVTSIASFHYVPFFLIPGGDTAISAPRRAGLPQIFRVHRARFTGHSEIMKRMFQNSRRSVQLPGNSTSIPLVDFQDDASDVMALIYGIYGRDLQHSVYVHL